MCIPLRRETLDSGVSRLTAGWLSQSNFAVNVAVAGQNGIRFIHAHRKVRNDFVAC